ncbi:MAG TPA: hypothetical protein VK034_10295, partial [Enhygromyxa sp.]|nr:hypothetical protein [Enhygromyxa sp.]
MVGEQIERLGWPRVRTTLARASSAAGDVPHTEVKHAGSLRAIAGLHYVDHRLEPAVVAFVRPLDAVHGVMGIADVQRDGHAVVERLRCALREVVELAGRPQFDLVKLAITVDQ